MPVYNASAYLEESINSLFRQTFREFVLIAIDDCSTDDSFEMLKTLAGSREADGRIRVFRNGANRGVTDTLNFGLDLVETPYTARMDADDISEPSRLAAQLNVLENEPKIGLVSSAVRQFRDHEDEAGFPASPIPDQLVPLAMTFENPIVHPTVMLRTQLLRDNNLRYASDKEHVEDYDLFCRVSEITRIRILSSPLLRYRMHPQQVSAKFTAEQSKAMRAVSMQQFRRLGLHPTPFEYRLNTCLGNALFPVPGFRFFIGRWGKKLAHDYSKVSGTLQSEVTQFIEKRQCLAVQRHMSTLAKLGLTRRLYWRGKSLLNATRGR